MRVGNKKHNSSTLVFPFRLTRSDFFNAQQAPKTKDPHSNQEHGSLSQSGHMCTHSIGVNGVQALASCHE